MEFSISRSLQQFGDIYTVPFPNLTSQPVYDDVNPGIGQVVNLYETIVPMKGKSLFSIETKVDLATSDVIRSDTLPSVSTSSKKEPDMPSQIGTGETKMDSEVLQSFLHPIKTDSIIFEEPNQSKETQRGQKRKADFSNKKVSHKFHVL